MKKQRILIGIDPDVDKSGVAIIKENILKLQNLSFFELFVYLKNLSEQEIKPVVYVELGSLNKSNWHIKHDKSSNYNAKIGTNTGRNFEVANKIVEMCVFLKLVHYKIKPTRKKIKSDEFKKLTGATIRTNQEQRDAFMLVFGR